MALTPYSYCPCGSGKKFRFCCSPIHEKINKAFRQDEGHQYEAAMRTMDEVTTEHSTNPEAWGRKAQLLFQMDKETEARDALDKALQLNPQYPFGHFLAGKFRQFAGDIAGALANFRLAAQYYHPEAKDTLAGVYSMIADNELQLRRPIASRAALEIGRKIDPSDPKIPEAINRVFGDDSPYPPSVCKEYALQPLDDSTAPEIRRLWKNALESATTGKLEDARGAFEKLTVEQPELAPAWFNLGLVLAWLGRNPIALDALDRYLALESNEEEAADAWELGEILRFGQGMEDHSDYVNIYHVLQLKAIEPFIELLEQWENEHRLMGAQVNQETNQIQAIILEKVESLIPGQPSTKPPRRGASLVFTQGIVSLSNVNADAVQKIADEIESRVGDSIAQRAERRGNGNFLDVLAECLVFPIHAKSADEAHAVAQKHFQEYFEERWIHRPLHSLNGVPPIDAVGSFSLRKKLMGVIQFLENTVSGSEHAYDFDRLRRKVDLISGGDELEEKEINAYSTAELTELNAADLEWDKAVEAFQTAMKVDAKDLAGKFAENLISRPANSEHSDRYPCYLHLTQLSLDNGDQAKAFAYLDDGERFDCEQNDGKRRNEYELRRGQLHAKCGETDKAEDVFQRLIDGDPDDFQRRGSAIEALLSANQGAAALRFANGGLDYARKQNDGDAEHYFMDLKEAAQRQVSN